MNKPADLLRRQIEVNRNSIAELYVSNISLNNEITENNETIAILEAANSELSIAISKLEENV